MRCYPFVKLYLSMRCSVGTKRNTTSKFMAEYVLLIIYNCFEYSTVIIEMDFASDEDRKIIVSELYIF